MEKFLTNVIWAVFKPIWYAWRIIKAIGEWLWNVGSIKAILGISALIGFLWLGVVMAQVIAFCWGW